MKGNGGEAREMGEVRTVQDVGRQFMRRRCTNIAGSYRNKKIPTIDQFVSHQFAGYHRNDITEFFPL